MANKWFIAIKKRGEDIFDISGLTILESPKGHYYADPFLVEDGEKTYLFFEDYDYTKGVLAVGELDGLELKNVRTVLDEPWHLSFPSVFKEGENWYMTPECVLSGELWLYKAIRFPDLWGRWSLIARGRYDDPVIQRVANGFRCWASFDGDKQAIFESPTLDQSEWHMIHHQDSQYARAAGHFLDIETRPTQDAVPIYGHSIKFKRGDKVIGGIEPDWYPGLTGTHTFNVSSKYVALDGRVKLS